MNARDNRKLSNREAERAIIGILMTQGREALARVIDQLDVNDFSSHAFASLFQAMVEMDGEGIAFDTVIVMGKAGQLGDEAAYEAQVAASNYTGGQSLHQYVRLVRDARVRRQLYNASVEIGELSGRDESVDQLISMAHASLLEVGRETNATGPLPLAHGTSEWLDKLDQRSRQGTGLAGISTGFRDLDRKTGGLEPGNLVIVAGRPSMGKTALALDIGLAAADRQAKPIVMFSMEMGHQEILSRAVSKYSKVSLHNLRVGELSDSQWGSVNEALAKLPRFSCFMVDEESSTRMEQMRIRARRVKVMNDGISMVIVDYLQLMETEGENRASELASITRGLKAIGKDLGCPVILVSQLNREVEKRADKRPMMSDLKESGAIEQDADLILFVYRDHVYNPGTLYPDAAEVIIAKQRNGPTGAVLMSFHAETASFRQMEIAEQQIYWDDVRRARGTGRRGYD